jgi:NADH-quinone oxidoreductase subunit J
VLSFFAIAGYYVLLNAQFIAAVQVIVYSGAILVLFLFVIMMIDLNIEKEIQKSIWVKSAAVFGSGSFMLILISASKDTFSFEKTSFIDPNLGLIESLGITLFTEYLLPFEVASILLLSAMIGAVMLGKKDKIEK